jgi:16S rRNA (cytidine1402-2'-O)-methyltransferase
VTITAGKLHLIPVDLGDENVRGVIPPSTLDTVAGLDYFIVENEKSARRFLAGVGHPKAIRELLLERFDKDSDMARASELLQPVLRGRSAGLLSEAGAPAVADPGALLVAAAHAQKIEVVPHVGASAILLALMASGFNGQRFAFHGYLPVPKDDCRTEIRKLELESRASDMTQLFIETPYRNDALLKTLIETCAGTTRLCVASALTTQSETIYSGDIAYWKQTAPQIGRRPSVFLLYAR